VRNERVDELDGELYTIPFFIVSTYYIVRWVCGVMQGVLMELY
jgi:hypothetical protein